MKLVAWPHAWRHKALRKETRRWEAACGKNDETSGRAGWTSCTATGTELEGRGAIGSSPGAEDLLFDDFEMMQLIADGFQVALARQARQEGLDAAVELVLVVKLGRGGGKGGGGECKMVK